MGKISMYCKFFLINCSFLLILISGTGQTQQLSQKSSLSIDSAGYLSIGQLFTRTEQKQGVKFFYNEDWFLNKKFPTELANLPLNELLIRIRKLTGYGTLKIGNSSYVFVPVEFELNKAPIHENQSLYVVGNPNEYGKYKYATLSGKISDGKTGEPLIGAILIIKNQKIQLTTDKNGLFAISLPVGEFEVRLSYMGYEDDIKKIKLVSNGFVDLELFEKSVHIEEILVTGEKLDANVLQPQMSIIRLNSKTIKELPVSLGEKDIIKSFTLMPGIQATGEFGSGFNVRGGSTDQNLILVQDVPLFNSSHVFGLTSAINTDNVTGVTLFKGDIPAQYGERVASVMDIEMGSTTPDELKVKGGIGLLFSRLSFETPMFHNKLFLQVGARSSYSDWLLQSIPNVDLMNSSCRFYDFNALLKYNINSSNKLSLFGYYSNDQFNYNKQIEYNYNNILASVKWNHTFNSDLSGYLMAGLSSYIYHQSAVDTLQPENENTMTSTINYYKAKGNITWLAGERQNINTGFEAISYNLNPGTQVPNGPESIVAHLQLPEEKAVELALFVSDGYTINKKLTLEGGLRFTEYLYLGPAGVNVYNPDLPRDTSSITKVLMYGNNKIVQKLPRLEPRLSIRYSLNDESSFKLSYSRVNQFINLISNTIVVAPTNVWKLSDPNTPPLQCDQLAFGYFRNFRHNTYETSCEVYYKNLDHVIDYKDGANIVMNPQLESSLLDDKAYNYGAEIYVKKNAGQLTGWLSYTYSVARQRTTSNFTVDQVNNNSFYPSLTDRPNNLVVNANYHYSKRWRFSGIFTYCTGRPTTYPEYTYNVDQYSAYPQMNFGQGYQLVEWSARNKYRLPDYHRLDLSISFDESLRLKKKWKGSWTFSIINVYGRKNVYSVFYQSSVPSESNNYQTYSMYKIYIIGQPLPTLTYNFTF